MLCRRLLRRVKGNRRSPTDQRYCVCLFSGHAPSARSWRIRIDQHSHRLTVHYGHSPRERPSRSFCPGQGRLYHNSIAPSQPNNTHTCQASSCPPAFSAITHVPESLPTYSSQDKSPVTFHLNLAHTLRYRVRRAITTSRCGGSLIPGRHDHTCEAPSGSRNVGAASKHSPGDYGWPDKEGVREMRKRGQGSTD